MNIHGSIYPGWIIPNVINKEQCSRYIKFISKKSKNPFYQQIKNLRNISVYIYKSLEATGVLNNIKTIVRYGRTYELLGPSDYVTLSKHYFKLNIHRDTEGYASIKGRKRGLICFYKVAIYLNEANDKENPTNGGTEFYDKYRNSVSKIQPETGKAVIFDMREWHSGIRISKPKTKYMIGIRLVYKRL